MTAISLRRPHGFTLIEMIMVIVILGIIAAVVAVFIRGAADSYVNTERRAVLTDTADTALRRVMRDVRGALPNSLRVDATGKYAEFLPVVAGGRYRQETLADFSCFEGTGCTQIVTLGSVLSVSGIPSGWHSLVIYSPYNNRLGDCSNTNPSVYCGHNVTALTNATNAADLDVLTFALTRFRPDSGSPGRRFFVIAQSPVSYGCVGSELIRYSSYSRTQVQATPPAGATASVLAENVNCAASSFNYAAGSSERYGLLIMKLTLNNANASESVQLLQEVHVDNAP